MKFRADPHLFVEQMLSVGHADQQVAGRSTTAANEIKDLIQDSVKKVEDGPVLVAQSGQKLEQIVSSGTKAPCTRRPRFETLAHNLFWLA